MNWARGFWRLWTALSIMYVAICVVSFGPGTYKWLFQKPGKVLIELSGGTQLDFDLKQDDGQLRKDVLLALITHQAALNKQGKQAEALQIKHNIEAEADILLATIFSHTRPLQAKAYEAFAITAVPPAILLMLGIAWEWIARGFRPKRRGRDSRRAPED
jgi:hypothetical protein